MNIMRCPFCDRRVSIFKKEKMRRLLLGISSAMKDLKLKEQYPDYGKILNETVAWTLYQEKSRKFSAPVDMGERIKTVIKVNYPDAEIDDSLIDMLQVHVLDIMRYIQENSETAISKNYNIQRIYFNDKPYWDRKISVKK